MCENVLVAVRVVVVVGNVVVVAVIDTYLVIVFVTIVCKLCLLLHLNLHLVVIGVLYSLSGSSISFFGVYVSNSCVCDLLLKCVYLDRVCSLWSM